MTTLRLATAACLFPAFIVSVQGAPAPPTISQTCTYSCPTAEEAAIDLQYPVVSVYTIYEPGGDILCTYQSCYPGAGPCVVVPVLGCYYETSYGELIDSGYKPDIPGSCPSEADSQCATSRRKKRSAIKVAAKRRSTTRSEGWSMERNFRARKDKKDGVIQEISL